MGIKRPGVKDLLVYFKLPECHFFQTKYYTDEFLTRNCLYDIVCCVVEARIKKNSIRVVSVFYHLNVFRNVFDNKIKTNINI